jgi:hypothetical protein
MALIAVVPWVPSLAMSAGALRNALGTLNLDNKTKILGYKTFEQEVIGQLDTLYDELNGYLIDQNLLPHLDHTGVNLGGGRISRSADGVEVRNEGEAADQPPTRIATDRLFSAPCTPVPAATPSGRSWCWWTAGR